MDNYQIADSFSLLAKLMDIHGDNSFKAKSYASAAFTIEKLPIQLCDTPKEKIAGIKGLGTSSAQKIIELLETGRLKVLDEKLFLTPPGVVEMLNIKGIGPKKIHTIWKEMEIESIGELLYACKENRLKIYKGFGEKTQQNVMDVIEFYMKNKGSHLYAHAEIMVPQAEQLLTELFPGIPVLVTGKFARQLEVVDDLEFIVATNPQTIEDTLEKVEGFTLSERKENALVYASSAGIQLRIYWADPKQLGNSILVNSCEPAFHQALCQLLPEPGSLFTEEQSIFSTAGLPYIPPALRDHPRAISLAREGRLENLIQPADIRGIIHCHSNWSDGSNSIEEMARAAMAKGLEYLVISDHSKSAFYANGLQEERIRAQHAHIDELNEQLRPFKIFKSIESDILNDGSLDYSPSVLSSFDLVIASVHSNLKMSKEKAMARLLKAIENPYTTILGHMTGRLLLSREGYPVDHSIITDACAEHGVTIELNAHPNRLDISWTAIGYALEKNVLISIDPDAHHIDGLDDTRYGVLVAQKAFVSKENNLSSFSLQAFEQYVVERKTAKGLV